MEIPDLYVIVFMKGETMIKSNLLEDSIIITLSKNNEIKFQIAGQWIQIDLNNPKIGCTPLEAEIFPHSQKVMETIRDIEPFLIKKIKEDGKKSRFSIFDKYNLEYWDGNTPRRTYKAYRFKGIDKSKRLVFSTKKWVIRINPNDIISYKIENDK